MSQMDEDEAYHSLTLASSEPDANIFVSTELKSTLQHRFSCS